MASGGYPGEYEKGEKIEGLKDAESEGAIVFSWPGQKRRTDGFSLQEEESLMW